MLLLVNDCRLEIIEGDLVRQDVDAIVNAANSALAGGGGVDGALHRAAGPALMEETRTRYPQGCPAGSAVITRAGQLPARYVIHAVGPVWQGGRQGEAEQLAGAYGKSLDLAIAHDCQSVAFPAISTGAYGYPPDLAADIVIRTIRDVLARKGRPHLVRLVLFSAGIYGAFARVCESLTRPDLRSDSEPD